MIFVQDVIDERSCSGFTFGAGNADNFAWTEFKKDLSLGDN